MYSDEVHLLELIRHALESLRSNTNNRDIRAKMSFTVTKVQWEIIRERSIGAGNFRNTPLPGTEEFSKNAYSTDEIHPSLFEILGTLRVTAAFQAQR